MLLPSAFCLGDVTWSSEASHLQASFMAQGEQAKLDLTIDQAGRLKTAKLPRWGNPDGAEHRYVDFGAIVEEEGTLAVTRFPPVCGLGGTSVAIGLSQRASSSAPLSIMQSIDRLP